MSFIAQLTRKTLLGFYVVLPAAMLVVVSAPALAIDQPNIVLIVGDDVGFSDLGSYGSEINTPHLDELAALGVRFSNFHVTASCSPTRSMLMTGVDNHRNGLGNMDITMPSEHKGQPGYDGVLSDRVVTIAQLLRDNGYHTYQIGKWHLGNAPDKRPYNRGFERTIALGDTGADNWEQRSYLPTYDKAHWYADGEEHQLPDDFYSSRYFIDKTIEFIDANRGDGRPFFAYIGFQAVHIPVQAPSEFVDKYRDVYQGGWEPVRQQRLQRAIELGLVPATTRMVSMATTQSWDALAPQDQAYNARRMAVYAGMLDAMDFHIGRLLAHLRATGEFDNTVFVFLSDNGPEPTDPLQIAPIAAWINLNFSTALEDLGAKGSYAAIGPSWASAAASPGAYYKFFAGEGGVRVPLIITAPGRLPGGQIEPSFAFIKDLVPTLLALTGTADHNGVYNDTRVEPITGASLLPVLTDQAPRTHAESTPVGYELSGNAALYKGDYKLLRNLPPLGDGEWHLYDITVDPGEANDLRNEMPARFEEMLADYEAYAARNGVLEMPEGYDYVDQVLRYTASVILKRNAPYWLGGAFVLGLLIMSLRRYWRRSRARA